MTRRWYLSYQVCNCAAEWDGDDRYQDEFEYMFKGNFTQRQRQENENRGMYKEYGITMLAKETGEPSLVVEVISKQRD